MHAPWLTLLEAALSLRPATGARWTLCVLDRDALEHGVWTVHGVTIRVVPPGPEGSRADAVLIPAAWGRDCVEELTRALPAEAPLLLSTNPEHVRWGAALAADGEALVAAEDAIARAPRLVPALVAARRVRAEAPRPAALPEGASPPIPLRTNPRARWPFGAPSSADVQRVVLRVAVTASGQVSDVAVLSGAVPFGQAALALVRQWRFEPARSHGRPLSVFTVVRVSFRRHAAAVRTRHATTAVCPSCAQPAPQHRELPGQ